MQELPFQLHLFVPVIYLLGFPPSNRLLHIYDAIAANLKKCIFLTAFPIRFPLASTKKAYQRDKEARGRGCLCVIHQHQQFLQFSLEIHRTSLVMPTQRLQNYPDMSTSSEAQLHLCRFSPLTDLEGLNSYVMTLLLQPISLDPV